MSSATILALALGANAGWAVRGLGGPVIIDTEKLKPSRIEGNGMPKRLTSWRYWGER